MTIDVDDVLTDEELDEFLGGQVLAKTTLRPAGWVTAQPARQYALDEVLRILYRAHPSIDETLVDVTSTSLKRAVLMGAAARLYFLAMTNAADASLFYALEKKYTAERNDEIRALGDEINRAACRVDPKGRGRRSISIVRR